MTQIFVVGNVNLDLIMGSQKPWPTVGTEVILPHMEWRPGGAAGNAALALKALGASFQLIAASGQDALGAWLQDSFKDIPGKIWSFQTNTALTVGIVHPDGERTFFSHLGHLEAFKLEHVVSCLETAKPGDVLLLLGVFVLPRLRAQFLELLIEARRRSLVIVLDTGWATEGWAVCHDEANAWLPYCDHLLINEIETFNWGAQIDFESSCKALQDKMPKNAVLVVKQGSSGASWYQADSFGHCPAPKVKVVDTIGAGDTFNAGYLSKLVLGEPLETCVKTGIATASLAVSTFPRVYTLAEVRMQQTPQLEFQH
jgi:ribokinase